MVLRLPDRTLVYSARSGRHLVLPADAEVDLERLAPRLAPGPYPCRSRLVLTLPERGSLWHPVPSRRGPGGFAYAALPLGPEELAMWRRCDGHTALELPPAFIDKLCHPDVQALQLRPRPVRGWEPALERLCAPERPPNTREHATLADYHAAIDPAGHFDHRETTVAHCFAVPHPALGGEPFGARLRRLLGEGERVLEIGCGTGELARDHGPHPDYTRLDLSPGLLQAQAALAPWTRGVLGDAMALPFPADSFDRVICNEVLADMPCEERAGRLVNTGAMRALSEIRRVLRPGGLAWVSEFGREDALPQETLQLDHPEVSLHFGELLEHARSEGEAELQDMAEALQVDRAATWLARPCFEALRALWPGLPARAVLPELPEPVEGLWSVPVTWPGPGPAMANFRVLWLR